MMGGMRESSRLQWCVDERIVYKVITTYNLEEYDISQSRDRGREESYIACSGMMSGACDQLLYYCIHGSLDGCFLGWA